jgi:hypothetical protein
MPGRRRCQRIPAAPRAELREGAPNSAQHSTPSHPPADTSCAAYVARCA